jgi:hypothetical protein
MRASTLSKPLQTLVVEPLVVMAAGLPRQKAELMAHQQKEQHISPQNSLT